MTLFDRRLVRWFDAGTLLILAALLGIGMLLVASASAGQELDLERRQGIWVAVGLLLTIGLGFLNYRHFTDNAYVLWGICVAMLGLVLVLGPQISGARSWLRVGSVGIQPSELAKVAIILALARLFADREPRPFGPRGLVMPMVIVAVPFGLTALQPDQGTAITYLPILAAAAWAAGLHLRTIGIVTGTTLVTAPLWYLSLHPYQQTRLTSFLAPEADPLGAGYQLVQSKIAVGSGGLMGKGLFSGTQSQLNFLPEQENDFIVALLGEEIGFFGVAAVLLLYLALILRLLRGAHVARDRAGAYICVGVAGLLTFHLAVNAGMVIGYLPITGIPLPLLSYGGSSALATCIAIGLVISVRSRRFVV